MYLDLTFIMLDDEAVRKWLSGYDRGDWAPRTSNFKGFLSFLRGKPGFEEVTPSWLLDFHRKSVGDGGKYKVLDLLQEYVNGRSGRYNHLYKIYSDVRTFFKKNRVPLPDDDFKINADVEPVQGRLTVDVIKVLVDAADLDMKAFYLTLWMGILDLERFQKFNEKYGYDLAKHLGGKGVGEPFMVSFPGRKQSRNKTFFHTYIGRDALNAWREYFERMRGYPKDGEAALLDLKGDPIKKDTLRLRHLRLLEKLHYIKRGGERSNRYGYHLHDFRDECKTLLHLQGKREGLDLECVDFWMGHVTDPNHYDKFYRDKSYTLEQYSIAEKHLNITSGPSSVDLQKTQEKMKQYETLIQQMSGKFEEATRRLEEVERKLMSKEQSQMEPSWISTSG